MHTKFIRRGVAVALGALLAGVLAACGGGNAANGEDANAALSSEARLGAKIFVDQGLSASGRQSCQSCHDPAHGHGAPNHDAGQPGGKFAEAGLGGRSSPSIRYLKFNGAFHFDAEDTPTGGFFWDGRAGSLQEQAGKPLLNPAEMANDSVEDVVRKLAVATYAAEFQRVFGADIFSRPQEAFERASLALAKFQQESPAFAPFSSKYDAVLRGQATLTAQEQRGLEWFNRVDKGNCAACHPSEKAADGTHPLFTDFSYDALGVPRNPLLKANADAGFFDLGLCAVPGFEQRTDLCGAFKVPTLRNVALRGSFFHNGRFTDLKEALTFYVTRDTDPARWYTQADRSVVPFDDLPPAYRHNVNRTEAPYDRQEGAAPALSAAEIQDLIAFLNTLTDGWQP